MSGPDKFDSTVAHKPVDNFPALLNDKEKYRIAYFPEALDHPSLDQEIGISIKNKLAQLEKEGHKVQAVKFDLLDYIVPAYYVLTTAEASSNLSRFDGIKYGYRTATKNIGLTEFYKETRSAGFGKEVDFVSCYVY